MSGGHMAYKRVDCQEEKKRSGIESLLLILMPLIALIFALVFFFYYYNESLQASGAGKSVLEASNSVYGSIARIMGFAVDETAIEEESTDGQAAEEQQEAQEQAEETQEAGEGTAEEAIEEEKEEKIKEEQEAEETEEKKKEKEEEQAEEEITEQETITEAAANETIKEVNETAIDDINDAIENITEEKNITNITIPETAEEVNITIANETQVNITEINETITNETLTNVTAENITALNITTMQYKAVINRPVKWVKAVKIDREENKSLILEIPKQAVNITVRTGEEVQEALSEAENYGQIIETSDKNSLITGQVSYGAEGKGIITRLISWLKKLTITGRVIEENELQEEIIEKQDKKEIDVREIAEQSNEEEIAVEYYTDAPTSEEEITSRGKKVIISGPDELSYEDVLAYTTLDNSFGISAEKIKVYWHSEEGKKEADFYAYDLDEDGNIDYIEWNVPHLSNQTYEIIYISKAEHLDENYNFIEEVYPAVFELDDNYALIPDSHYIRVTFEKPLDKTKDITIYARSKDNCSSSENENNSIIINGTEIPCEIYQKKIRIDELRRILEE